VKKLPIWMALGSIRKARLTRSLDRRTCLAKAFPEMAAIAAAFYLRKNLLEIEGGADPKSPTLVIPYTSEVRGFNEQQCVTKGAA